MNSTVFFSYSRQDSEFALKLGRDLRAAGAAIWLDQLDIKPGERWDVAIQQALAGCARLLVILSPSSVESTNVMDEVSYALEENKLVIPVLYQECSIPFRLRRLQYTDFRGDHREALNTLVAYLAADAAGPATTVPLVATTTGAAQAPPSGGDSVAAVPRSSAIGSHAVPHRTEAPAVAVRVSDAPVRVDKPAPRRMVWLLATVAVALVSSGWVIRTLLDGSDAASVEERPAASSSAPDRWGLTVPTYVITAGAFKTEREAQALRDTLRRQGHTASHLWIPDYASLSGAQLFLTFVGPFGDIDECRRQLAEFRKSYGDAYGILVAHQSGRVECTADRQR